MKSNRERITLDMREFLDHLRAVNPDMYNAMGPRYCDEAVRRLIILEEFQRWRDMKEAVGEVALACSTQETDNKEPTGPAGA